MALFMPSRTEVVCYLSSFSRLYAVKLPPIIPLHYIIDVEDIIRGFIILPRLIIPVVPLIGINRFALGGPAGTYTIAP